jgi:FixJ family two-component response regulator
MKAATPVIFIVDDDVSVQKSLARLIRSAGYAVEAFGSAEEFLSRGPSIGPCCLVLDVRMPGVTGLDLQKALAGAMHGIPIVFITGHGDVSMGVNAMKAGAVDFLTKPFEGKDLLEAVQRAVAKDARDLGTEARTGEVQKRVNLLTPRQRQVFALVVTGMLNKQIASELHIAEKTVKVHRAQVMEKMRARSVAELVRLADEVGLIVTQA